MNKSKYSVCIVGAGNLGRRHIQGLSASKSKIDLTVVDLSEDAIAAAISVANDVSNIESVEGSRGVIPDQNYDVAILASTASSRLEIYKDLINKKVKSIIVEKVAFNSILDIEEAGLVMNASTTIGVVNCPRRMYQNYKDIKSLVVPRKIKRLSVKGSNYGLACNGIHYLDLFAYIIDDYRYLIESVQIEDIYESKRPGFIEVDGLISGRFDSGAEFSLSCAKAASTTYCIEVECEDALIRINEIEGTVNYVNASNTTEEPFLPVFQSQLTGIAVDQLVNNVTALELTPLKESLALHKPFVQIMYEAYSKKYGSNEELRVPIT